jgi:hypothetical protein
VASVRKPTLFGIAKPILAAGNVYGESDEAVGILPGYCPGCRRDSTENEHKRTGVDFGGRRMIKKKRTSETDGKKHR